MHADVSPFDQAHRLGDPATRSITRFSDRLAALLLLAGLGPLRRRALPAGPKTTHSTAFN